MPRRRIQLKRTAGWRMPPNTVKVDRSTKWGNPFVVGLFGTRAECVDAFEKLLAGWVCVSGGCDPDTQRAYFAMACMDRHELKGKNLACWCPLDEPCHVDVLLRVRQR